MRCRHGCALERILVGDAEVHEGVGQWIRWGAKFERVEELIRELGRELDAMMTAWGGLQRCMAGDMDGWMQMWLYLS